ncbi:MAG: methyltransferase domain-containing protein [Burkholderiales bacterium]
MNRLTWWFIALLAVAGCASNAPAPDYQALVASADRTDADRTNDLRRKPALFLAFMDVRPGMSVADISAGGGYTTELLARAVGATGRVYAHNLKPRLEERLKRPAMKNVVEVAGPFEHPFPAEVRDLDLVTFNFNYHDTTYMGVDRASMNRAIFAALKPGGHYIVADHSALPGAGTGVGKSLHRIEDAAVQREVEAAGFKLVAEGGFLRNPADPRTAPVTNPAQPNDEFVFKFVKP